MITFKIKKGLEGYELTKDFREEYLKSGKKDKADEAAFHIAGFERDKIICSGRMYVFDELTCVIDNVIVDKDNRKQYIGDTILRAFEDKAVQLAKSFIKVIPTEEAKGFFKAEGYDGEDEMKKNLAVVRGCRGCGGGKR